MTEPSCLNCAFGKDKEQKPGFYCGGEGSHADVYHFTPHELATISHPDRNHHHMDWATGDCNHYKPRQNKCQADGCKWWGDFCEHEGHRWFEEVHLGKVQCNDFKKQEETMAEPSCLTCVYGDPTNTGTYFCKNPWMIEQNNPGGICWHNEGIPICAKHKQEETMETIKVNGKVYEWTDKPFTLRHLFEDARGCPDAMESIHRFWHKFSDPSRDFNIPLNPLTPSQKYWLVNDSPQHIPWLLEKGYLREVVEEEKQLPNQWYKGGSGALWYSDEEFVLTCMKTAKDCDYYVGEKAGWNDHRWMWTKIDPPVITEQSDTAEKRKNPTSCVHHKQKGCLNDEAIKHFGAKDSVSCSNHVPDGCPAWNDGKDTAERRPELCVHDIENHCNIAEKSRWNSCSDFAYNNCKHNPDK